MKIHFIHCNKELRDLLCTVLEVRFGIPHNKLQISDSETGEEARGVLVLNPDIDLIISGHSREMMEQVKKISADYPQIPILVLLNQSVHQEFSQQKVMNITMLGMDDAGTSFANYIETSLANGTLQTSEKQEDGSFCRIRTLMLVRMSPLKTDIFIRLSENKFIKLMREGDFFDGADLERYYQVKKVEHLYIKKDEVDELISKLGSDIQLTLKIKPFDNALARSRAAASQEVVRELIDKVGFSRMVQDLAKDSVRLTVASFGAKPDIYSALMRLKEMKSEYIGFHSILLAELACCVATLAQWSSPATFQKLALAAFFHDVAIKDNEIAALWTPAELNDAASRLGPGAARELKFHPIQGSELVKQLKEIPPDVDIIVVQHHERPDGSGYPRGLTHTYIGPLSAVFIVAHDMLSYMLAWQMDAKSFNILSFLETYKDEYCRGHFKMLAKALEKYPRQA